jgi:hypothetical protein
MASVESSALCAGADAKKANMAASNPQLILFMAIPLWWSYSNNVRTVYETNVTIFFGISLKNRGEFV